MHALSVTDRMILSTMNKLTTDGVLLTEARKCPDARRVAVNIRDDVKSHIAKFPIIASHYIVERIAAENTCHQVCHLAKSIISMSMTATKLQRRI